MTEKEKIDQQLAREDFIERLTEQVYGIKVNSIEESLQRRSQRHERLKQMIEDNSANRIINDPPFAVPETDTETRQKLDRIFEEIMDEKKR